MECKNNLSKTECKNKLIKYMKTNKWVGQLTVLLNRITILQFNKTVPGSKH